MRIYRIRKKLCYTFIFANNFLHDKEAVTRRVLTQQISASLLLQY